MSQLFNLQMVKYIYDLFNADKIRNAKGEDMMNEKMYFDELDNFGKAFRKQAAAHAQEQNEKPQKVNYQTFTADQFASTSRANLEGIYELMGC